MGIVIECEWKEECVFGSMMVNDVSVIMELLMRMGCAGVKCDGVSGDCIMDVCSRLDSGIWNRMECWL